MADREDSGGSSTSTRSGETDSPVGPPKVPTAPPTPAAAGEGNNFQTGDCNEADSSSNYVNLGTLKNNNNHANQFYDNYSHERKK